MSTERKRSGFTLVEILIVVIILGILAAIIIPQFSDASNEARESTLTSNLQILRSQVGLYKIQHRDVYPDSTDTVTFETALTTRTDELGAASTDPDALGPYMQRVPNNPFTTDDADPLFIFGVLDSAAAGGSHWFFNTVTGAVIANDGGESPDGTLHSSY